MIKRSILVTLSLFIQLNPFFAKEIDFDSLLNSVEVSYSKVNDYTCKFSKKDYIDGKYYEDKNVIYKHKKTKYYYLKYTQGSLEGSEVIYAGKKYDNKLRIHLGGMLEFVDLELDPKGKIAMKGNRHSILESDFGFIINLMKTNYLWARKYNEGKFEFVKETLADGRKANLYLAEFPVNKGYYAHRIYICLDVKYNLPVRFIVYNDENQLIENYEIMNLKINTGLTDKDFDVDNPSYDF